QAEDGIRVFHVTGVQTCALPISPSPCRRPSPLGGRGRRHGEGERRMTITLIDEAVASGARVEKACEVIGISARTLERWRKDDERSEERRVGQEVRDGRRAERATK